MKQRKLAPTGGAVAAQPGAVGEKGDAGKRVPGGPKQRKPATAGGAVVAQPAAAGRTGTLTGKRVPEPRKQGEQAAGWAKEVSMRTAEADAVSPARAAWGGGLKRQQWKAAAGKTALAQPVRVLAQAGDQSSSEETSGGGGGATGLEEDAKGEAARVWRARNQGGAREGPADESAFGSDEEACACSPRQGVPGEGFDACKEAGSEQEMM